MKSLQRVLIMAGGTGGHVFPGLALAHHLREHGVEVQWLGTQQGLEARLVPQAKIPLHLISIGGVRGKSIKTLLLAPFRLVNAIAQAMRILSAVKPNVVVGMGGFVSGPGGIASWLMGYPLVIHEQNAKAGLTNKWLRHVAKKVLTGFPDVFPRRKRVQVIGNPVRAEIAKMLPPSERMHGRDDKLHLLVLGGSLGAQALNAIVPLSLAKLNDEERPEVYHQTGDKHFAAAETAYKAAGVEAKVVPFITNMQEAYAWADVVLCRAGALTIAELCAAGLGSILVPFPHAVDDHQTANAQFLIDNGAAVLIQQKDLTEDKLVEALRDLTPQKRLVMANVAYGLRKVDVTEKMFNVCCEVGR